MTRISSSFPRALLFLDPVALVAAGFVVVFLAFLPAATNADTALPAILDHPDQAPPWTAQVLEGRTILTIEDPGDGRQVRSGLVALPASASGFTLRVEGNPAARASVPGGEMIMRGVRVLRVLVEDAGPGPVSVVVERDGGWADGQGGPLRLSPSLHACLDVPALAPDKSGAAPGSCYVVVYPPAFANLIDPLVEWKTRKGLEVVTVSTAVTGPSTASIKAWLQEAYDTWSNPPEYILLVGDVDEIPTFNFHGNPTDLPFTLLEGDDWLPDAMIGRLPVENDTQARTVLNKIVAYERHPFVAEGTDWFTRSIMVGGVEGSDTPPHTVRFCGEQLQKIGFAPAQTFLHPPLPSNALIAGMFNPAMDTGASIVTYRGWAYGTSGWSDPRYTVDDMGGMSNGGMLPVVMSFVCLNGDYTHGSPCFGEAFLRLGLPEEPRGAIAFIGNGEHWSHTRFNDAMAISFFERIIDPGVTDLGSLMTSGKLRFMDYFPGEMDAETHDEESVEFYFHIYNLLGDPDLDFWKSAPLALAVDFDASIQPGANSLAVTVTADGSGTPVSGARVVASRGDALLGTAVCDDSGQATLVFPPLAAGTDLELTVSGPGLAPFESTVAAGSAAAHVTIASASLDDGSSAGSGNADGVPNPGETLALTPTMINNGTGSTGTFTVSISAVTGPATIPAGSVDFTSLGAGESAAAGASLPVALDDNAADGDVVTCTLDAVRGGDQHDLSVYRFTVVSPDLTPVSLGSPDGTEITPGGTFDLALTLSAAGTVGTAGGTVTLALVNPEGASLTGTSASFGSCQPGTPVTTGSGLALQVDNDLATGTNLSFTAVITTSEGYVRETTCGLVVGPVDVTTVCGPDSYGYYAYDSADLDYPANRPQYTWNEISPTMGGGGTRLDFPVDNEITTVQVDLPFSFPYYGQDYDRIRVSDNGWISFDLAPDFNFYNWPIPSEHGNNALIAPYWDNLVPTGSGGSNGIEPDGIFYEYDAVAGTFTVEWSRLHHYKPQILGLQTFQVVLLDPAVNPTTTGDGEIMFFYRDVTNNDHLRMYATVGLEGPQGRDGLQLSYAAINDPGMAPLQPGLAVLITTEQPVRVPFTLRSFTASEDAGAILLQWQPADDRPVLGWHVDRVDSRGTTRLTETPLPAGTRRFTDRTLSGKTNPAVKYRLTALHPYGATSQPGEVALETGFSPRLALHRASPNPAPGSTSIAFVLPENAPARLRVYDTAGRLVRTLIDGNVPAGEGIKIWDGRDDRGAAVAGGVYFFRLETRGRTLTRKMILVR